MTKVRQMLAIARVNLRSLRFRASASLVAICGIAGVVLVIVALASMARGLESTLRVTGHADRVLILRAGSNSELNGAIPRERVRIVADKPGLAATSNGPAIGGEIYTSVFLPRVDARDANLPLRGVSPASFSVRREVRIVGGRMLEPGKFELIVGRRAAEEFAGLAVGKRISVRGTQWEIVGEFASGGSVFESEAWADVSTLAEAFKRGPYLSSITAKLQSPAAFAELRDAVAGDPRLQLHVWRESDYYAQQASSSTAALKIVGGIIGAIMGFGAIFAALNTMYAAVNSRTAEIATLKALGFSAGPILGSVLIEAVLLSVVGGCAGVAFAWAIFDGYSASTLGATFAQVAFEFAVTPGLAAVGVGVACVLGVLGGLMPALRAARLPVVEGLREG